jgi:hypothetical protein
MGTEGGCNRWGQYTGTCTTGTITGDHVDVSAHESTHPATGSDSDNSDDAADAPTDADTPRKPPRDPNALVCDQPDLCPDALPPADDPAPPPAPTAGVSMSDLASFYPSKLGLASEPNGWAVVGLDTNFFADAPAHMATGRLLNRQASVLFTPTSFEWDYGDGHRATTNTAGRSWSELGVAEFSTTPTSHIYITTGTFNVQLTVVYTAQYRFGGGAWRDVPGTLRLQAPTLKVVASNASTVLVQRDCAADPGGPGC